MYYDAIALSYAAMEPFPTINPALLYSGEIAMGYVLGDKYSYDGWLDRVFQHDDSFLAKLFCKFFSLVTGEHEF